MLNKVVIFACLCALFLPAAAQNRLGLKLDVGASYVRNTQESSNADINVLPSLSGQFGLFKEWGLEGKSRIGVELLGTYVQGKNKFEFDALGPNLEPAGTIFVNYTTELFYFSVPLWYGMDFGPWTVNVGVQGSVLMSNTYWEDTQVEANGTVTEYRNTDVIQRGFRADVGPRAALFYRLNDRINLEASYYYGMINAWEVIEGVRNNWWKAAAGIRVAL